MSGAVDDDMAVVGLEVLSRKTGEGWCGIGVGWTMKMVRIRMLRMKGYEMMASRMSPRESVSGAEDRCET